MKLDVTLIIEHDGLSDRVVHNHIIEVGALSQFYKKLDLANEEICELKNYGRTVWIDENGATHTLEIRSVH